MNVSNTNVLQTALNVDVQINTSLNINKWDGKPSRDDIIDHKLNVSDKWETFKNIDIQRLADIVSTGDAIRGAIKIDGNSRDHIDTVSFLCLDFDDPVWSIADSLASELIDSACILYKTSSYTTENQKHRLIFALSRPVDSDTASMILKNYLYVEYIHVDKSCCDVGRFYYGSRHAATVLDPFAVLDVDIALSSAASKVSLQSSQVSKSTEVKSHSEELLEYLHDELFIKLFDGNCLAFYTQHFLDGCTSSDYRERGLERDEVERYELRYNVFNPETYADQSGFKAVLSYTLGTMPFLLDHTERTELVTKRTIATFIDYWLQWQSREDKALAKKYLDCRSNNGVFHHGIFDSLVYDICAFYNVPQYKIVDPYELLSMLMLTERNSVFRIANTTDSNSYQVKLFLDNTGFFEDATSMDYVTFRLKVLIDNLYPNFVDIVNAYIGRHNKESGRLPEKYIRESQLDSWLNSKRCLRIISGTISTVTEFFELPHLIPIGKNLFNVLSKETLLNQGQAKNSTKPYPDTVVPGSVKDNDPVIIVLKRFFHEWSANSVKGDVLLSWLILCACRQAYKTRRGLVMIGRTQLGKTGYCQIVMDIMNYGDVSASCMVGVKNLFGSDDNHSSENLHGHYFNWVDEANSVKGQVFTDSVKLYMQGERGTYRINPKGKKGYTAKIVFGVAVTVQDELNSRTDEATDGRLIQILIGDDTVKNTADFEYLNANPDKILSWCLSQDVEHHLKELNRLASSQIFKDALREQKQDVDLIYAFLTSSYIELTHDIKDRVEKKELFAAFNRYVASEQMSDKNTFTHTKGFIKAVGKCLLHGQGLWDKTFNPSWLKSRSNGLDYILGLKLVIPVGVGSSIDFVND